MTALRTLGAEYDHSVTLGQDVVNLNAERAVGQLHEVLEKSPYFGVPAVVARDRSPSRNVPENIFSEDRECTLKIAASECVVAALNQRGISWGHCCFCHLDRFNLLDYLWIDRFFHRLFWELGCFKPKIRSSRDVLKTRSVPSGYERISCDQTFFS